MIQSVWKNLTGLQKAAEHLWCDFKCLETHPQTPIEFSMCPIVWQKNVITNMKINFSHDICNSKNEDTFFSCYLYVEF